jgi:UPF0716 protein FxsA
LTAAVFYILFALFILLPLAEIWVLIQVGSVIGALPTIALMIAISLIGAWLVRQQSLSALLKAQAALSSGHMPVGAVADGAGLMLAAVLIMTPGLITSTIGTLLLVPPIRRFLAGWTMRRLLANATIISSGGRHRGSHRHSGRASEARPASEDSGPRRDLGGGPVIDGEFETLDNPDPDDEAVVEPGNSSKPGGSSPWRKR